jgi:hypothetical protein
VLGLTAAAGIATSPAMAGAEWQFTPAGQLFTLAQQNARLESDNDDTSASLGTQASIEVSRKTERLDLGLRTSFSGYRYRNDDGLDRDEFSTAFSLGWLGERIDWSGAAGATRDTTLTSELGTTGLTQGNQRHENYYASFGPSLQVSERVTAGGRLGMQADRYPDPDPALVDFSQKTGSIYVAYAYSERFTLTLAGFAGRLESDGPGDRTSNESVTLQAGYVWGPLLTMQFSVGPSRAKAQGRRENGLVYSASIARGLENGSLSLTAGRSQSPAGRGVLTELEDVRLAYGKQFSERLSGSANVGMTRRTNAIGALRVDLDDVRYRHANLEIGWRLSPNWVLGLAIGGTDQRRSSVFADSADARGYDARLSLGWRGNSHVY